MNLPNKLTITRIILVPILILIYMFPYATFGINVPMYHILNADISLVNIVIFIIFAVASLTDYFDGQIARKSKLITTFGKFADPIADKLLINTIFLLLASDGTISIIIPIIMISRDTIVDAIRLVAANKQVVIAAKYLGKLKTVTQMISVIFLLLNDFPFSIIHLPIGQISVWIACVISIVSGIDYFMDSKDMLTELNVMNELAELLIKNNISIGTVESFTVGNFATMLGNIPGISKVYKGSLVTYQSETKERLLGIEHPLIEKYGVVSKEIATLMCVNGKSILDVDLCVSFTGNAGRMQWKENQ